MYQYTYKKLPSVMYSEIELNPVDNPEMVLYNECLSDELGLDLSYFKSNDGINVLSGNKPLMNEGVIAQAYCGHQYGYLSKLGDGRALLLGEVVISENDRFDLHLKGSGRTPYSREGDGRGTLSAMLREYIMSEALHALGVSTTRALSVIKSGEKVYRESIVDGAILTRVASSHIRVGTFEYANIYGGIDVVRELADYTIDRHFPYLNDNNDKYKLFLRDVCERQAMTIAKWQSIGFIHGVMNTDNILISGETIDYGPCAFMNTYNPDTVFSSIDRHGRYSYTNQPLIGAWNLARFAETLIALLDDDEDKAISIANETIDHYNIFYKNEWLKLMARKIGINNEREMDESLINDLLQIMLENELDFTNTFRQLTKDPLELLWATGFNEWYIKWKERLKFEKTNEEEIVNLMKQYNCNIIPRNHLVEAALKDAAEKGNYEALNQLLEVVKNPYNYQDELTKYTLPKEDSNYKTYCNT